jgi:hypothetical protein
LASILAIGPLEHVLVLNALEHHRDLVERVELRLLGVLARLLEQELVLAGQHLGDSLLWLAIIDELAARLVQACHETTVVVEGGQDEGVVLAVYDHLVDRQVLAARHWVVPVETELNIAVLGGGDELLADGFAVLLSHDGPRHFIGHLLHEVVEQDVPPGVEGQLAAEPVLLLVDLEELLQSVEGRR